MHNAAKQEMKKGSDSEIDSDTDAFETESEEDLTDDEDMNVEEEKSEKEEMSTNTLGFVLDTDDAPGIIHFDCVLSTVDYPRKGENPSSIFTASLRQLSREHPQLMAGIIEQIDPEVKNYIFALFQTKEVQIEGEENEKYNRKIFKAKRK